MYHSPHSRPRVQLWLLLALTSLLALLLTRNPALSSSPLQSGFPTSTPNPQQILASRGARLYCGLKQSSVWLDVPVGFTSEWGAEIHFDPTDSLSASMGVQGAWDNKGCLLGIYPHAPLVKPLSVVFDIDQARLPSPCNNCFEVRYYDQASKLWQALATSFNPGTLRVTAGVTQYLPESKYPAYEDRALVALFVRAANTPVPTKTPTRANTPRPSPTLDPTSTPLAQPTATPTAVPTATPTELPPPSPTADVQGSAAPTPETQPSPTPQLVAGANPAPEAPASPVSQSQTGGGLSLLVIGLLLAILVMLGIIAFLLVDLRGKRHAR